MGISQQGGDRMRVLFVLSFALLAVSAVRNKAPESDDLQDLADLGQDLGEGFYGGHTPLGDTITITQDPTTQIETNDTLTAECYQNSLAEAKLHCESKVEEDQCDGAMRDWYCDAYQDHVCEADKPEECRAIQVQAEDTFQAAKCCNWDANRTPKCTIDETDAAGNQCTAQTKLKA